MSLSNIISTSLSGLFVNQSAMKVTSNNIANVNTPNYARSVIEQKALVTQGQSAGVGIANISAVIDEFLSTAYRKAQSNTSEFSAQREFHDRLQGVLGDPAADSSLSARMDQIFQSVADLSLNPADVLRRQQSLSETQSFLDQLKLFHSEVQNLRGEASQQISETVDAINEQLQRINDLNPLLVKQKALGQDTGGVEGQMSDALATLASYIDIRVDKQPTGALYISTASGYPLVDTTLSQLKYNAPGIVGAGTVFPPITVSRVDKDTLEAISSVTDLSAHIQSGRLAGLLDMRDNQLTELSVSLGELAAHVADEFNAIQNEYSAAPPPNSLTGKQTLVDGSYATNFTGVVTFAVVDGDNELVATTTVDFDSSPPADFDALVAQVNAGLGGNGTLSLVDGVMSLTATNASNGVVIANDPDTPSDRAGRTFSHFFGMNDLITSDVPGIYETGLDGTEAHGMGSGETIQFKLTDASGREVTTVTVPVTGTTYNDMIGALNNLSTGLGAYGSFALDSSTGALSWSANSNYSSIKLEVTSDTTQIANTGLSFTAAFGVGDQYRVNAARNINIVEAIAEDPDLLALSVFDLSGSVGDIVLTNGDQRGALALQALETTLVGFSDAGELKASNVTLTQYVSRFLGNAGLQASRASNFEEDNMALLQEIGQRNSDVSGVNLDEELANLVIYQNAYNAAARILSSVQELYDSLLAAV
ncbi:flagellar hook-associated protein FlgK [Kordiimonas pumila]|uniref:Flagellar hook-associated protein 1 n=1 Tax=Kordiimonas pumila TaxID=2161677 RepID=A0ABV7D2Z6_9PROT|nr:flagellar hook-associated protein FlgK [Kordiimonas pumila]